MKTLDAIKQLSDVDKKFSRCVFSRPDLSVMFPADAPRTLEKSVERLVKEGVLERVARGVYVFAYANSKDSRIIESIALVIRRHEFNCISLESALSEYGRISQIPIGVMTVMTTGRSGVFKTPYGTIEFTHTKRSRTALQDRAVMIKGRPLPLALEEAALDDLKSVGRNLNMVDEQ